MSERTPSTSPTPSPGPRRRGRIPTAVSVVAAIVILSIALNLVIGVLLWRNLQTSGVIPVGIAPALTGAFDVVSGHRVAPAPLDALAARVAALRMVYSLLVAAVLSIILGGVLGVRRWGWTALMTWSGLNLAVQLYFYARGDPRTPGLVLSALATLDAGRLIGLLTRTPSFGAMGLHALAVLALNLEEVQSVFGVRAHRGG